MSLVIPDRYCELIDLIYKYHGYLFGGAVRDFLSGVTPNDIDVSISDTVVHEFYSDLEMSGYIQSLDNKFVKNEITVDVSELPEDAELSVDINVSPDFDVNCLAWDGHRIFNFWNPQFDIAETLKHINEKKMVPITPSKNRMDKMLSKGWKL